MKLLQTFSRKTTPQFGKLLVNLKKLYMLAALISVHQHWDSILNSGNNGLTVTKSGLQAHRARAMLIVLLVLSIH